MEDKLVTIVSSHESFSFLPTEESHNFLSDLLVLKNKELLYLCCILFILGMRQVFTAIL